MIFAAYSSKAPVALVALPSLAPKDALDILLVAFLIYQALMIVRGTRAGHILLGTMFIVGLYVAALVAGLEALRSVLSYIVPYVGLAVIILFQSEIRRTLARLGRKRWFGRGYQRPEFTEDILLAVRQLAADKTGALIVLERDIGLRSFIESGVRMDAALSSDLLLAIFYKGAALHDGAAIIQKDRIAAANCYLPLTIAAVSSVFGTRHRAAIGVTEETDCLSVVVSEETGRISVAAYGELKSGLTLREVDERICTHFGVARSASHLIDEFAADIPMEAHPNERAEPQ